MGLGGVRGRQGREGVGEGRGGLRKGVQRQRRCSRSRRAVRRRSKRAWPSVLTLGRGANCRGGGGGGSGAHVGPAAACGPPGVAGGVPAGDGPCTCCACPARQGAGPHGRKPSVRAAACAEGAPPSRTRQKRHSHAVVAAGISQLGRGCTWPWARDWWPCGAGASRLGRPPRSWLERSGRLSPCQPSLGSAREAASESAPSQACCGWEDGAEGG